MPILVPVLVLVAIAGLSWWASVPDRTEAGAGDASGGEPVKIPDRQLTEHFSLAEFVRSSVAARRNLDNTPPAAAIEALEALARVLETWRASVGPLAVTSGYRSPQVNAAVGGAADSQHTRGEAADVKPTSMGSPAAFARLAHYIQQGLPVDQAILYAPERGGHIHVSHKAAGPNRGELRFAPAGGGYEVWRA